MELSNADKSNKDWVTPCRQQSKTLPTIDEPGSKIDRNSVFDCLLSPVWRQIAIENPISIDFWSTFLDSIGVFDCRLPGVGMVFAVRWVPNYPLSAHWSAHWPESSFCAHSFFCFFHVMARTIVKIFRPRFAFPSQKCIWTTKTLYTSIGTASANSAKFRGIRPRIYFDNAGDNMTLMLYSHGW